jgi:cell division protein FtsI/penicillin-binding protein 2
MEVEFDDEVEEVVEEMMVVRKEFDHCQEKLQWTIDIEVQQKVDLLLRESFETHKLMSYSMCSMISTKEK